MTCPETKATAAAMEILPSTEWSAVSSLWCDLANSAQVISPFLSHTWAETWLAVFGESLDARIAVFREGAAPYGICLLVRGKPRQALLPVTRITLNASGERPSDTTYIEYNNLLCRTGWESLMAARLAEYAESAQYDQVALDGFVPGAAYEAIRSAFGAYQCEELRRPSYYADLRVRRNSEGGFESVLGHATRKHLRQNIRRLTELGPLRLQEAEKASAALEMFDEMAAMNRQRWESRSCNVVFSSPRFLKFHRDLIARSLDCHTVQLLRVAAGEHTVGIVYNLKAGDTVYLYQCGLNYSLDDRLSPGTVTLFYAIQHALQDGAATFDFMAGSEPYKERLSTGSRELVWTVFRRLGLKTSVITMAYAAKRRVFGFVPYILPRRR